MQKRRRNEVPPAYAPDNTPASVDSIYWEELQAKDLNFLCNLTLFTPVSDQQLSFPFLNENILVDLKDRCLKRRTDKDWEKTDDPLLELVTVLYLNGVNDIYPMGKDIVSAKDLREGHFFQGPHALKVDGLIKRYGHDLSGFKTAAENLRGEPVEMADAAFKVLPFPRIPLYYLLWEGDDEFQPRVNVLFDRPIEEIFAADGIWGLVNRVATAFLM